MDCGGGSRPISVPGNPAGSECGLLIVGIGASQEGLASLTRLDGTSSREREGISLTGGAVVFDGPAAGVRP